jgi:hypothetical protein
MNVSLPWWGERWKSVFCHKLIIWNEKKKNTTCYSHFHHFVWCEVDFL